MEGDAKVWGGGVWRERRLTIIYKPVICLLPRLGMYSSEAFVHMYLNTCMNHLLAALRNQNDRAVAFISLGEIAVAVGGSIFPPTFLVISFCFLSFFLSLLLAFYIRLQ